LSELFGITDVGGDGRKQLQGLRIGLGLLVTERDHLTDRQGDSEIGRAIDREAPPERTVSTRLDVDDEGFTPRIPRDGRLTRNNNEWHIGSGVEGGEGGEKQECQPKTGDNEQQADVAEVAKGHGTAGVLPLEPFPGSS
jgi:hypothetical protein